MASKDFELRSQVWEEKYVAACQDANVISVFGAVAILLIKTFVLRTYAKKKLYSTSQIVANY